jgi:hypothetical protein
VIEKRERQREGQRVLVPGRNEKKEEVEERGRCGGGEG